MKKLLAIFIVLTLFLAFGGCNKDSNKKSIKSTTKTQSTKFSNNSLTSTSDWETTRVPI